MFLFMSSAPVLVDVMFQFMAKPCKSQESLHTGHIYLAQLNAHKKDHISFQAYQDRESLSLSLFLSLSLSLSLTDTHTHTHTHTQTHTLTKTKGKKCCRIIHNKDALS